MAEKEQAKPLAVASHRNITDEERSLPRGLRKHRFRRCIKCSGCIIALILILAVAILILAFTLFHVTDPILNLNSFKIDGWSRVAWLNLKPGTNLTVTADVSVKNPNAADFKYNNAKTSLFYGGITVGEAWTPPGLARARRTVRLNVTFDAMLDKIIMGVSRLGKDLVLGSLEFTSYTRMRGRISFLKMINKAIVVTMNCTLAINVVSHELKDQNCKHEFSL